MARISFLLTVIVICVRFAQGKWEHENSNTNINENRLISPGSNRQAKFLDMAPLGESLLDEIKSFMLHGVDDDDVNVFKKGRKPPSRGDQRLVEISNEGRFGQVHLRGNGKINLDRNQLFVVGQPKQDSVFVLLPTIIRDSTYLQSNIAAVAENPHVDSNSNRIKGQLVGMAVNDGVVVTKEERKPPSRGGQSLVELLNGGKLGQVLHLQGNGKINSDMNQFVVGQPKSDSVSVLLYQQ